MYNTGKRYNTGERYNLLGLPLKGIGWYTHLGGALAAVVDGRLRPVALLHQAYKVFVDETLSGEDKLTFFLPHPVPAELAAGALIDLAGKIYRAVVITDREEDEGTRVIQVEAWALWYDLAKMPELPKRDWVGAPVLEILAWLLHGTGWSIGYVAVVTMRVLTWGGGCNRLEALRELERVFNAEIVWDTAARTVSVAPAGGADTGVFFLRGKNLRKAEVETSVIETVHRLYPRGHRGLQISAVNNGIPYLEIPSPYDPPPSAVLAADGYTDPQMLKEYAEAVFAEMNAPQVSYICEIVDLSALSIAGEEHINLGDVVTVYDSDAGINIKTRIVRMHYDVLEPWNSRMELSTVRPDMAGVIKTMQQSVARFEVVEMAETKDIAQLMVFNHLLNSRADDGFAYWINDGWGIDNTIGFSGPASFRAVGQPGVSKTLLQTIHPAHRESYVISLRALLENVQPGAQGRAGVEVVVHYTDGTRETHYISLV
ncbi:MAG: phage tail protein [Peptococcaceae bacterium]|jgi:phage minor structural protein|nr:phage tail protein [Peptococcaceae bacterium]